MGVRILVVALVILGLAAAAVAVPCVYRIENVRFSCGLEDWCWQVASVCAPGGDHACWPQAAIGVCCERTWYSDTIYLSPDCDTKIDPWSLNKLPNKPPIVVTARRSEGERVRVEQVVVSVDNRCSGTLRPLAITFEQ